MQYVLPTDAPYLSRHAAPLALAVSPLLWARHRPDCFDTYSAGKQPDVCGPFYLAHRLRGDRSQVTGSPLLVVAGPTQN